MSETNHYSSQLTGQQIDEALMAARNIRNNSGVPVSSGTGLLSFRNLDTTLDGKSGGIPTSPAVMQAIKNTQSTFLNFRGSVPTVDDLPADPQKGDTYKVAADGHFYAWNGSGWDDVGTGAVAPTMASDIPTDDNRNVQEVLNQHQTELEQHQALLDAVYPVGAIYMSTVDVSPAGIWGGTWERIKDCFLLSAGDSYAAGAVGGEATHTLTVDELPAHNHKSYPGGYSAGGGTPGWASIWAAPEYPSYYYDVGYTGGGQSHNNMPPYLTVYMWKRTA